MNDVIMEIEDKILDEVGNWWDIVQLDYDDKNICLLHIYAEVPEMNIEMRVSLPSDETNFHYRLEADYIDVDMASDTDYIVDIWYDTIDDLLDELKSTKVLEKVNDWYGMSEKED